MDTIPNCFTFFVIFMKFLNFWVYAQELNPLNFLNFSVRGNKKKRERGIIKERKINPAHL